MLFCCMYGTVVLSLVVVLLTDKMDMDSHETRASIVLDKLEVHKKMKQSAAYIIGGVGKMRKINSMKKSAKKALLKRFAYHVHRFKSLREQIELVEETGSTFFKMARELKKKQLGVKNERKRSNNFRLRRN